MRQFLSFFPLCLALCLLASQSTLARSTNGEVCSYLLSEERVDVSTDNIVDAPSTGNSLEELLSTNTYASTDIPISISATGTSTLESTITVPVTSPSIITDLSVTNLSATHTFVDDLSFKLISPAGTEITLASGLCSADDDLDLSFNDSGTSYFDIPCPPTTGLSYEPSESISTFYGEDANGTWTLIVEDRADLDGGSLDTWSLEITTAATATSPCTAPSCTVSHATVGSCINYTVNVGDTLCITEDYNCQLSLAGGTVYVAPGVTFTPVLSGAMFGTIINCGNATLRDISISNTSTIENYGQMVINNSFNFNATAHIINGEGAIMDVNANFQFSNNSTLINKGQLDVSDIFTVRAGSSFSNELLLTVGDDFTIESGGTVRNNGRINVEGGSIHINVGSIVYLSLIHI